jgi:hypothetical protein
LVTGASKRTVERWLDGHTTPKPHYAQRLNSLSVVRDAQEREAEAQGTYVTPSQMLDWFSTPNEALQGDTPAQRLAWGDSDAVESTAAKQRMT